MKFKILLSLTAFLLSLNVYAVEPVSIAVVQELQKLSEKSGVPYTELYQAARQAKVQQSIINAMNKPGEAKPWYKYREIFIIPKRINDGAAFWRDNYKLVQRAASYYKVAPEIIIAIIGVETFYGKHMGTYKVLDALYTLGFFYPKRAAYFSGEFANFVKLAKAQGWSYDNIKGSYAGAMGMGQFMPWSYMTWAVDFDGDGHKNLFSNKADAVGSVANYFSEHGWKQGEDIVIKTKVSDPSLADTAITAGVDIKTTVGDLRAKGVFIPEKYKNTSPAKLIKMEEQDGFSYYVGFHNFYVITLYNKSPLYALAVYQLSQQIKAKL